MTETTDNVRSGQDAEPADDLLGLPLADRPLHIGISQQREQLRALFRQAPLGIGAVILLTVTLTIAFRGTVPDYLLLPWLAFIGLNSALHAFILREYTRHEKRIAALTSWTRYQTLLAGASGLAWGIGFVIMLPHLNGNQQAFYLMLLALLCTIHLPVLAAVFSSYASYLLATALPVIAGLLFMTGTPSPDWLAGIILMSGGLTLAAWNYNTLLQRILHIAENAQQNIESLHQASEKNRITNLQLRKAVHDQEQQGLKLNAEKLSTELTLQSLKEAIITTDLDGRIVFMNPLAETYTGWCGSMARGRLSGDVIRIIEEKSRLRIDDPVYRSLAGRNVVSNNDDVILVRRDGLEYGIEFEATPMRDAQGEIRGAVITIRDISQRREQLRTLSWQASHDPLTGLINRREFEQRMENLLQKHPGNEREHALCFIDLDNFKLINDTCGHMAGDALLKSIAEQLRSKVRDSDTLARVGGDEFGLILYSCDTERAKVIGETLRKSLRDMDFHWDNHSFSVTASIGIVPICNLNVLPNDALRHADVACYQAKQNGGDQLHIHAPDSETEQIDDSESRWIETVMQSIRNRRFILYAQPIKALDTFNPLAMSEILLRVSDDEGRLVMPGRFLNVARRYHLLPQVDVAVLEAVLEYIKTNPEFMEGHGRISINITSQTANDPRSRDHIAAMLQAHDSLADRLCFELGEKSLVCEPDRSNELLLMLRRHGCRVAIDDFSFSLGAFRYLQSLNLDYIKIDARQMQDTEPRSLDYTLIESINHLSHRIGAETIVKNVDKQEVLDALHEIGVDYVQGYLIDRPSLLHGQDVDNQPQAVPG